MKCVKAILIGFALMASLGLGACQTDQATIQEYKTEYRAIVPPESLYQCPGKPPGPKAPGGHITDSQVAEYIVKLDRAHSICSKSLQAIKAFAAQAQLTVERQ